MKIKSTIPISLLIFILLAASCTIEKRLFQPGYNIEWKKKKVSEKDAVETAIRMTKSPQPVELIEKTPFESNVIPETEKRNPEHVTEPKLPESVDEPITPSKTLAAVGPVETKNRKTTTSVRQNSVKGALETEERKVFELFGVMSFGLYFCSLAMAVVSIFALNALPTIVIACFMILLSFIFGIISVKRYRRNRFSYRRNFFGYFGLIASAVTIFWTAFLLLFAWGLDSF